MSATVLCDFPSNQIVAHRFSTRRTTSEEELARLYYIPIPAAKGFADQLGISRPVSLEFDADDVRHEKDA
ncbi:MAG: hypothetical protein JO232_12275 [Verrucomicrobia bacterium]|nr:hypothetical protein [Verrucomicrobiota bacterium]